MDIIGICQIFNEVDNGNLRRALECYSKLCDQIIILDDNSSDNPLPLIKEYNCQYIKNEKNAWESGFETKNKNILFNMAKDNNADWVINFDADEIFEFAFNRSILDKIVSFGETSKTYSFGFNWTNLWLDKRIYRVDDKLNSVSPPRLYKVFKDHNIETVGGLHKRLWPIYADNPTCLNNWRLLHYSSVSVNSLANKVIRYCRLDSRFRNKQDAINYYLYNLLDDVSVSPCNPSWFPDDEKFDFLEAFDFESLSFDLQNLHTMVVKKVTEVLNG